MVAPSTPFADHDPVSVSVPTDVRHGESCPGAPELFGTRKSVMAAGFQDSRPSLAIRNRRPGSITTIDDVACVLVGIRLRRCKPFVPNGICSGFCSMTGRPCPAMGALASGGLREGARQPANRRSITCGRAERRPRRQTRPKLIAGAAVWGTSHGPVLALETASLFFV